MGPFCNRGRTVIELISVALGLYCFCIGYFTFIVSLIITKSSFFNSEKDVVGALCVKHYQLQSPLRIPQKAINFVGLYYSVLHGKLTAVYAN